MLLVRNCLAVIEISTNIIIKKSVYNIMGSLWVCSLFLVSPSQSQQALIFYFYSWITGITDVFFPILRGPNTVLYFVFVHCWPTSLFIYSQCDLPFSYFCITMYIILPRNMYIHIFIYVYIYLIRIFMHM